MKTKNIITVLLIAVILASCAPAAKVVPTETPVPPTDTPVPPTDTPVPPTDTPVPPTETPVPIPTLSPETVGGLKGIPDPHVTNPELFDLTKQGATIPQFVNAMRMAGIEVTAEQVASAINYQVFHDEDGKPFVVAAYHLDPDPAKQGEANEGNWPLMIRMEGGEWGEATTEKLADMAGINWGTGVPVSYTQSWSTESSVVVPIITENSNRFVIDYDLMWYNADYPDISVRPTEDSFNFKQLDLAVQFAQKYKLSLQGGGLLVSIPSFLPPWLTEKTDKTQVLAIAKNHITTLVSKYPQIDTWCVAAELENPYAQNYWTKTFGLKDLTWLKESFEAAHAANPNAKLAYSDFDIEFGGSKADKVFKIISDLKQMGTPIDTIEFQMHLNGTDFIDPNIRAQKIEALKAQIARYKEIGIEVNLPEFDLSMHGVPGSESLRFQTQAQIEYDIMLTLLQSGVTKISHYGGNDKLNWKQQAINGGGSDALATTFDMDGNPKLNYFADMKAMADFLFGTLVSPKAALEP